MEENLKTLKNFESVREDMKFISNSISRLNLIKTLYDMPSNTKDLNRNTSIGYSAISTNLHMLELAGYIYRENNLYYLSNAMDMFMTNILEFSSVIGFIDDFFYFLNDHYVQSIPDESLYAIGDLIDSNLIISDGLNIYETYEFIEKTLNDASYVNAILPFYYSSINDCLADLLNYDCFINLAIPFNIRKKFEQSLDESDFLDMGYFSNSLTSFLLISTDKVMILGLFKKDGTYDQNRLLTANDECSLRWAENLFKNFKEIYK